MYFFAKIKIKKTPFLVGKQMQQEIFHLSNTMWNLSTDKKHELCLIP